MDFIRRLKRENFYFSSQSFQIWWLISGIEVRKTHKISAQYLKKLCLLGQKNHRDMGCEYHYSFSNLRIEVKNISYVMTDKISYDISRAKRYR